MNQELKKSVPLPTLVASVQSEDQQQLPTLLSQSREISVRIACTLVPRWAVDDVVQDTLLIVMEKLHLLEKPDGFRSWLSRITLNTCYLWLRKTRRRTEVESAAEPSTRPEPPEVARMRGALEAIGQKERDILVLREYIGLEYEELADVFRIPVGTVRSRLFNARKKLKVQLQKGR